MREKKDTQEAMDSFDLAALRQLVHTIYAKKEFVSQY